MRYEFLLDPLDDAAPFDSGSLTGLMQARGIHPMPLGGWRWDLKGGPVELKVWKAGVRERGLEMHVPLSGNLELIREAVVEGLGLAKDARLRILDPQLGRVVSSTSDLPAVSYKYLATARYSGEYLGLPESIDAAFPTSSSQARIGFAAKVALMLAVLTAAVFWAVRIFQ